MHNYFTNYHTPTCMHIESQHDNSIYIQSVCTATTQTDFMRMVATE